MIEKEKGSLYRDYAEIVDLFGSYLKTRINTRKRQGDEIQGSEGEKENSQVLLGNLHRKIENCQKCCLHRARNNVVFGDGNPDAKLMLIGEAPGREEDLQGKPFVGAAGKLLTEDLGRVGLSRADVYIANIIKCRPPDNRNPQPEEIEGCFSYLERQIEIIKPKLICTMGNFASQLLLNTSQGITRIRGKVQWYKENTPVVPIFHPAACIYKPGWERDFVQDLKLVRDELEKRNNSKNNRAV